MIEITVLNYLKSKLDVPVYLEIPASNTTKDFVLIEKTSSGKENQINSATFAIQSWGQTLYHSALLNESVKEAMELMPYEIDVSKAKLNSDYNFTDTTTKSYRYQAVFDLIY